MDSIHFACFIPCKRSMGRDSDCAWSRTPGAVEGVPVREIAEAIGRRLNVPVASKSSQQAAQLFTWLAPFLEADDPVSSKLTQERLGFVRCPAIGTALSAEFLRAHGLHPELHYLLIAL